MVAIFFFVYDLFVFKRNENLLQQAAQTTSIVMCLFPENVRDRLMKPGVLANGSKRRDSMSTSQTRRLQGYLNGAEEEDAAEAPPIADLFPNCTVLFAGEQTLY